MNNVELLSFRDDRALAESAADQWLKGLEAAAQAPTPYCVALSGGRIARRFFDAVTSRVKIRPVPLTTVHFFWGDERCVPPTDPESNFGIAHEFLLRPLGIPEDRIHRVRGEELPEPAAAQAEAELRGIAPPDAAGQPILDLIFLGMGEDGHVASLFPGESEEVMADQRVYRPVMASKPPPQRITLGYSAVAAAKQTWVLASGRGKENVLRESLGPAGRTPLARVLKLRHRTRIFTDLL